MSQGFFHDLVAIFADPYVAIIFVAALGFDFINGFHDAANSIATIVGTRVMRPGPAVLWAAWWNFAAAWVFGLAVANTVAKWVRPEFVTPDVILAGLLGAIVWDLVTWYYGLPTSSSHALLGGFGGAAMAYAGTFQGVLHLGKFLMTVEFIVLAPLIGFLLGLTLCVIVIRTFWKFTAARVDRWFRIVQLGSAAAYSLGHGTNDAQKMMGIIASLLYATIWKSQQSVFESGKVEFPFWIVIVCHLAIALGTMTGGWRIVKTMGMKLTKLRPYGGACAETAAAVSLFTSAKLGVPVSTTHTITGAIIGVGTVQRFSAVRWGIATRVVWAWVLTIPMSGLVGAACYALLRWVR
ncbi:MAG TPA: inorganic phosphate transporter [Candidatus Polarisedimenticolaceae bacterium]|nr:inorganic phosphate transporter [Candidatus Polarisedimenticolaceae bacterium]